MKVIFCHILSDNSVWSHETTSISMLYPLFHIDNIINNEAVLISHLNNQSYLRTRTVTWPINEDLFDHFRNQCVNFYNNLAETFPDYQLIKDNFECVLIGYIIVNEEINLHDDYFIINNQLLGNRQIVIKYEYNGITNQLTEIPNNIPLNELITLE